MEFSEFLKSINSLEDNYPPVHLWNPDLCVGVEMRIDRAVSYTHLTLPTNREV